MLFSVEVVTRDLGVMTSTAVEVFVVCDIHVLSSFNNSFPRSLPPCCLLDNLGVMAGLLTKSNKDEADAGLSLYTR